ncbi:MAG TPA: Arc family DNA-binding protein [Intrasporangium sp.]|nr:Arc family DNA-binding protein [Intrasporangium sp.]
MSAAITIRRLSDETKERLRLRAAANGRSMEAEARAILDEAVRSPTRADFTWAQQLIVLARDAGGFDIPVPDRTEPAPAADLS